MPDLWRLTPGQQLAHRGWQDEFVVYNNLSGDTHLLDGDTLSLLAQLRHAPASIAALCQALGSDLLADDRAALPDTLHAMLISLARLYLVERC
ncbi:HPr-rel-A system PqqD family peptide chaperone [Massilia sp. S19_KUP03_FR1]|uniref:HPr-rel-A system PqqD family peptide chaperone n=1 Tax=Massilia sp. S19_KUP03_FR1 TaxID=3025503 RepID=UPI002FCD8D3F